MAFLELGDALKDIERVCFWVLPPQERVDASLGSTRTPVEFQT